MLSFIGIIPARYGSNRFPGKPLADISGKPMIQHVYERASAVLTRVVVATDDERIFNVVKRFGGNAVMTSNDIRSGTDRCAAALEILEKEEGLNADVIINIQGDEPFLQHDHLIALQKCFEDDKTEIATLIIPSNNREALVNPNRVKVSIDRNNFALYFSRSVIPYYRSAEEYEWYKLHKYYLHIGIYAYRNKILKAIVKLPQGVLEKAESLEQLRFLENGYRIKTAVTHTETYCIDTPEDLRKLLKLETSKWK